MNPRILLIVALATFVVLSGRAAADEPAVPTKAPVGDDRIEELERKIDVLTEELRKIKEEQTVPEKREYKSSFGLGPAASKVYQIDRGLSIGGYGEFNLREVVDDRDGDDDVFDYVRLVAYLGYKFNDWIIFNSEIEFEHASTGQEGSVSVEFATLDFLFHEAINARAGLLLVPMGFLNELHEPPFYHGNVRPDVETQIIPSTWRANGGGIFGDIGPFSYRTYAVSGLDATGFASNNIRGARQNGSEELANDFAWVGRADVEPILGLLLGGSAYVGNSGQDQDFAGEEVDAFTQIYELHAEYKGYGFEFRALGALLDIDDADQLSLAAGETIPEQSIGWYTELAYNVLPIVMPGTTHYLAPWFRYAWYDTQNDVPSGFARDDTLDRQVIETGLSYKPIPQVVIKLDYRNRDADEGDLADEVRLGAGFIF